MRTLLAVAALWLTACRTTPPVAPASAAPPPTENVQHETPSGATFVVPAGWTLRTRGDLAIVIAPERDSAIAIVSLPAASADAAVAAAWRAYAPTARWPLRSAARMAPRDGWSERRHYDYDAATARRDVEAIAARGADGWTVVLLDLTQATSDRRASQVGLVTGKLHPRGFVPESFRGKRAHALDGARLAELEAFIERARAELEIPGIGVGVIQDGKIVLARGFGVRELGKPAPVDADTLFMIASNTKPLTTLMMARLVDRGLFTWDTPVQRVLPSFKLGDDATSRRVEMRHLMCACTGVPTETYETLLEFGRATPESYFDRLAHAKLTTKFGELFQYSNLLASSAGYIAGRAAHPELAFLPAFDRTMQDEVFDPLAMRATTLDDQRALAGNHAVGYAPDLDGHVVPALVAINKSVRVDRPSGGAWSTVHDMLRYVAVELGDGVLPDGTRFVSADALHRRRMAQVAINADSAYGIGLIVETVAGVSVLHHSGALLGYKSDFYVLPEHGVGAVLLTNSDAGLAMLSAFRRKLFELLFDARPEADGTLAARAEGAREERAAARKAITIPADPAAVSGLADHYASRELGALDVRRAGSATVFDFGEWATPVGSKRGSDGAWIFELVGPGLDGDDLIAGSAGGKRTLTLRDEQHEYVFVER
ncbi:MAG TPA: serine hydrolase domain-containing protein [Kofleriaceae bacterium]|nr:serine hydrolase domain-containing protein [Kofleriaceae bacterium]